MTDTEVVLDFHAQPEVPLWRLALSRKPGVTAGQELTPVCARLHGLRVGDSADYRALCGYPEQGPVPLLWPFVVAAPLQKAALVRTEFPIPLLGMVHLRQTVETTRRVRPDEALRTEVRVGTWRPARRGIEFDLETVLVDAADQVVWRGVTTAWSPRGPGHGEDRPRPVAPEVVSSLRVPIDVPENMGRRYGRVAGDSNPIHIHWLTARPFGFRRAIIHGMWTVGRVMALLEERLASSRVALSVSFRKPVFLPDQVEVAVGEVDGAWHFRVDGAGRNRLFGALRELAPAQ